ncbi:MAG: metallophosphoesterase [Candidatus Cloacimonetes bacterium]|nr:metallophosphoesterase [Candidatus Cloacimonadota bacterium]
MKKFLSGILVIIYCFGFAENITDGPYIFREDNTFTVKYILDGNLISDEITLTESLNYTFSPEGLNGTFEISQESAQVEAWEYSDVSKIFALSDIHGQFDRFTQILRNNNVIDEASNWKWGDGHLVITGDVFDRGDKVTESLWLIKKLEEQAKANHGKVHYILGNHEITTFRGETRHVNDKYLKVAEKMGLSLGDLYSENTFLGRWLRSKNTIVKINGMLFVHGGISPEFISNGYEISEVNDLIRKVNNQPSDAILNEPQTEFLLGKKGPFWYRGYFIDKSSYNQIKKTEAFQLLEDLNVKYIIVGHTTQDFINPFFNNRFVPIDVGIKYGNYGEGLLWKNDLFYRAKADGYHEQIASSNSR